MAGITLERRREVLKQLHAELTKIMGNIDGLDKAVAQFEKQAYDQSEGDNDAYIRRIALRLQRTKEKVEAAKAQGSQQPQQAQYLRPTPSPPPLPQHQMKQQHYHHQQQQQYSHHHHRHQQQQQPQYQQHTYHQHQQQYGQPQQAQVHMPSAPSPASYRQAHQGQPPPQAYQPQDTFSSNMQRALSAQPSMGPDAEIFAEMAQDLLLGPAQVQPAPLPAQTAQNVPQAPQYTNHSQPWQHPPLATPPPQQATYQQPAQIYMGQGMNGMPAEPAAPGTHTYWPGQQPPTSQAYQQAPQQPQQQSAQGDPATTEKYWRLLELMRQEFLADIAEYYNCMAPNIAGAQQPAYASKLAKMNSVIQRLSIDRDMPHYRGRQWSQQDLEVLQGLSKQLRMYCAKIRAALAPIREAKRKELALAAQRAALGGQVPGSSEASTKAAQAQGMPTEAALVRQPSVAAAVHQALPDMPVPPITTPLSDSSSCSRDLAVSEGMTGQGSTAAVKAEVPTAVVPGQSLVSRLAGSTPGALGSSAAGAEKLLKRKADLISSPSLPTHLQPALQGKTSSSEAFMRVESVNISEGTQGTQEVSPDRIFDFEAASRTKPSPEEAQLLQQLREKLGTELQQGLMEQLGKAVICSSDIPGTLIVSFMPEPPAEGSSGAGKAKTSGVPGQLSLRVDTGYPTSTPAYFRQVAPDQTALEQAQASAVQERFQAAVMGCQDPLTVTTLVRLWVSAWE